MQQVWNGSKCWGNQCKWKLYRIQNKVLGQQEMALTPFCLTLPQPCLSAGLRLLQCNTRNLTVWIQKALTCLVGHTMFSNFGNKFKNWIVISITLILSILGGYFSIDHVTLFKSLFWSNTDTKHYILSHFLIRTWFFCWKIIVRIIRFFIRTQFLSTVAAIIVKAKHSQALQKHYSSFS